MEAAFGWLGKAMEWIGDFIPRLTIVAKTHGGVAFVRGKNVKVIRPGLTLWWPFWTEIALYPTVRQSLDLPSQTLTTKDGQPVTVGCAIVYTVDDVETALTRQWDLAETIQDLSTAAVCDFVTSNEFDWINQNRAVVKRRLTKSVQEVLEEYGVGIQGAWLTDFAKSKVISMLGGGLGYYEEDGE